MKVLNGIGIYDGISFGVILFYDNGASGKIKNRLSDNSENELMKFKNAKNVAETELQNLYNDMLPLIGEEEASIFLIQKTMLSDEVLNESVEDYINNSNYTAEFAVSLSFKKYINMFSQLEDEYFRERGSDIKDIANRLIGILTNKRSKKLVIDKPVIIASEDLSPTETAGLDRKKVLAFVTSKGSPTSHTAILARTMNIPAIVGLDNNSLLKYDGCFAAVDGFDGKLYIEPDQKTIDFLNKKQLDYDSYKTMLKKLIGKENITKNGIKVDILSNISDLTEIDAVLENDSNGIGLFRSEFIFLANNCEPSEEQQFEIYKKVAEKMKNKKVIIRTFDLGADKKTDYMKDMVNESNPAMGCRAIRYCLKNKNLFKRQLRAICRASAYGNISVMFPMIVSPDELKESRLILQEVQNELKEENISFDENMKVGIMIETPAAAVICDMFCDKCDFFSIGTNDLTQYMLAMDRENQWLKDFYNPYHRAVFRLIKYVTDVAHSHHIKVSVCGELGSDINAIKSLVKMGIDSLSVAPYKVLKIRNEIRKIDTSDESVLNLY